MSTSGKPQQPATVACKPPWLGRKAPRGQRGVIRAESQGTSPEPGSHFVGLSLGIPERCVPRVWHLTAFVSHVRAACPARALHSRLVVPSALASGLRLLRLTVHACACVCLYSAALLTCSPSPCSLPPRAAELRRGGEGGRGK